MKNVFVKNILVFVFTIVFFILLLEVFSFGINKIFFYDNNANKAGEYCPPDYREWNPYTIVENAKNYHKGSNCNHNSYGFRGNEFSNNTKKIFILGGSTVWGGGASSENKTIPFFLNEMIKNFSDKYEVVNAGEIGYQSTQELISFHRKILRFKPEIIIVFDGRNDIYYSHKDYWTHEVNHDSILVLRKSLDTKWGSLFYHFQRTLVDDPFFGKSNFLQLLKNLGYAKAVRATYVKGKINPDAIEEYGRNLQMIADLAESNNVKSVFIFQPTLGYGNKKYSEEELKILKKINSTSNWLDVLNVMMPLGEKKVLSIKGKNVITASFANIFDNINKTIYVDSAHYNDEGNYIIAKEMFEILKKEKLIKE